MMTANPELKIVKPSFSEKFKSKNGPTISGVQTLLTALPIMKIGDVDDWTRLHPSEDEYWTHELCFVSVPIQGAKRDMLHVIDDDLAVQYLPAKKIKRHRLALACKPNNRILLVRRAESEPRQRLECRRAQGLPPGTDPLGSGDVAAIRGC
jgi:hypothetical protein